MLGLRITLLGKLYPRDIGPPGDREHYLLYTGSHYMGARAAGPVLSAAELRATAEAASLPWPGEQTPDEQTVTDVQTLLQHMETYETAFAILLVRFTELTEGLRASQLWSPQSLTAACHSPGQTSRPGA